MPTSSPARLPFVRLLVVVTIASTAVGACVSGGTAPGGAQPVTAANAQAAAKAQAAPISAPPEGPQEAVPLMPNGDIPLTPPDGRWYIDAEGQQYFLVAVPRVEGAYVWEGENAVRLGSGLPLKLARYDEKTFYAKVFRVDDNVPPPRRRLPPSEEERARVAATYEVNLPTAPPPALETFEQGLPQTGQWRDGFAIADMNEDGKPDIVHAPPRKALGTPPIVFLGDGAGHWQYWRDARFPEADYDYGDVAVADFDRDGHLDVALAMHMLRPIVVYGDGKGNFRHAKTELLPKDMPSFSSRAIRAVDFDRDGAPDLVALGEGMGLMVGGAGSPQTVTGGFGILRLKNRGDGTFELLPALAAKIHGHGLAFGDFDGDGRTDIAAAAGVNDFRELVHLGADWKPVELDVRPHGYIDGVAAGDLDGDGKDDVIVGYVSHEAEEARSGIDAYLSRPGQQPAWERRPLIVLPGRIGFHAVAIGDLDVDGRQDVVAVDGNGAPHFFFGRGRGAFAVATGPEVPPGLLGCKGYDVELVDLDGDRRPEVVAELAGEESSAGVLSIALGARPDCRDNGAIRVWKIAANSAAK